MVAFIRSPLRIARIRAMLAELPFRFSFGHALASRSSSLNLIVAIRLSDGSVGYGEGVAREYVTGETPEGALARVADQYGPRLLGEPVSAGDAPRELRALRDDLHRHVSPPGAAWCAVETALLDALGKATGRSAVDLFGGAARGRVQYGGVAPFASGAVLAGMLGLFRLYGFSDVKLKLGRGPERDLAAVRLARRVLGPDISLRVDANCAWSTDMALTMADMLRPFGVEGYEQPVGAHDIDGLARLTETLTEDVIVDESLCTLDDAQTLVRARACSVFNVRVSKCGGPLAALDLVHVAKEAGLVCQLGAQVGESGILTAAGRLVATVATPGFRHHEGADNLFLLRRDLTVENLTVRPGGRGDALTGPGLGVRVRLDTLQQLTRRSVEVSQDGAQASMQQRTVRRSLVGGE